jgi:hypothetical protein
MKLKIIYILLLLAGMNFLSSSKQCAKTFNKKTVNKEETKKTEKETIISKDEDDIMQLSISPFKMLLFNL